MTTISVFGLGYVGSVLAACLADNGHHVIGVDNNPSKVEMINQGISPVIEAGLDELIRKNVQAGRLQASNDAPWAVQHSSISFVCVGTPSHPNGKLNTDFVERVSEEIGQGLAAKQDYHVVAIRSTLLPGTVEQLVQPAIEQGAGKRAGEGFGLCFNPEFLREGTSIHDFYHPPYTIIGAEEERAAEAVKAVYAMLDAEVLVVPVKVAEMVKYVNNAFHALKVTFANEIGAICKAQNIDSHQVMDIFCMDKKLNISTYYLKPGFAFGGSCLPKDLRALLHHAHQMDTQVPVLEAILPSNQQQIERAYQIIRDAGCKKVGVLGLSFKDGTDDLRESPLVELVEHLIGKGYEIKVYDQNVKLAQLQGANKAYIKQEIPHIAQLMSKSVDDVLESSEVVVLGNKSDGYEQITKLLRDDQIVIDLVRANEKPSATDDHYQGIAW